MTSSYIPESLRQRVRALAGERCGYFRSHQQYLLTPLEIEHTIPSSRDGTDDEKAMAHNLLLGILFYPLWAQKSAKPSHFQPIWQDKAAF